MRSPVSCTYLPPALERFAATRESFTGNGTATPPTALKLPDIEHQEYGVAKPVEFRWNQLLSFDACVQCGKCEAACPAFASGQPLNPKKLIQDLVVGMAGGTDAAYAGSPSPGPRSASIAASRTARSCRA